MLKNKSLLVNLQKIFAGIFSTLFFSQSLHALEDNFVLRYGAPVMWDCRVSTSGNSEALAMLRIYLLQGGSFRGPFTTDEKGAFSLAMNSLSDTVFYFSGEAQTLHAVTNLSCEHFLQNSSLNLQFYVDPAQSLADEAWEKFIATNTTKETK